MSHEDLTLHVHLHFPDNFCVVVETVAPTVLAEILTKLDTQMATLTDIQAQNTALIAAVKDEDTVIDSAAVLITGFASTLADLKSQLASAIAANDPAATQAVVDSLGATITDINAKKDALAAAVSSGTPAAPVATPVVPAAPAA